MPTSTPSTCRSLLAALCAAVVVSGCAQIPQEEDAQAAASTASVASPESASTPAPGSAPSPPVRITSQQSAALVQSAPKAPATAADEPPPVALVPEAVGGMTDERRGLGLTPPISGPMSSIDGKSRPWEVPEIPRDYQQDPYRASDQQGMASWYGGQFHGRKTANGERFDKEGYTAAHKTLPFGTQICVRSMVTGKTVVVRVNDRGPYAGDRILDLSQGAAAELGMLGLGIKPVEFWTLDEDADTCPSFVIAGRRGAGRLAAPHVPALAKEHGGRVRETLPARSTKPAAGKRVARTAKAKAAVPSKNAKSPAKPLRKK